MPLPQPTIRGVPSGAPGLAPRFVACQAKIIQAVLIHAGQSAPLGPDSMKRQKPAEDTRIALFPVGKRSVAQGGFRDRGHGLLLSRNMGRCVRINCLDVNDAIEYI